MAWQTRTRPRSSLFLVATTIAIVASGCARFGTGPSASELISADPAPASTEASPEFSEEPLPVAEGETLLAVLDPAVVKPKVSAEEAIALARAIMGNRVGEAPRVQLVRLAFRDQHSAFGPEWTGWIIFSTDISGRVSGPYLADPPPRPSLLASYTWVYVTVDGEVMGASQDLYDTPESIPSWREQPSGG